MVSGLIIDAFGELRDQQEQVKEDMEVREDCQGKKPFISFLTQTLTSYTEYRIKKCAGTYTGNNMLILSGLVLKSKPLTFIISVTEMSKSSLSPPKTSPVRKLVLLLQLIF